MRGKQLDPFPFLHGRRKSDSATESRPPLIRGAPSTWTPHVGCPGWPGGRAAPAAVTRSRAPGPLQGNYAFMAFIAFFIAGAAGAAAFFIAFMAFAIASAGN